MTPAEEHDLAYRLAPLLALLDAEAKRARRATVSSDPLDRRRSFAERAAEDVAPKAQKWGVSQVVRGLSRGAKRFGRWPLRELVAFQKARLVSYRRTNPT